MCVICNLLHMRLHLWTTEVLDKHCSEEQTNKVISFNDHTVPAGKFLFTQQLLEAR